MKSEELVQRLFSYAGRARTKKSLREMRTIDKWQGHLHKNFSCIHVAGTNGKGSVSQKIAASYQAAGLRVGLYTSPHISTFRERIRANGDLISDEFISEYLPRLFKFIDANALSVTFFELLTALSFAYFAEQKVDLAVFEVGLGGLFDATNVIIPKLSVITSIEKDHTDVLGTSLEEIAFAKAGIIKPDVPVVVGPRANFLPIRKAAGKNGHFVTENCVFFDDENRSIAKRALRLMNVPEAAIDRGIYQRPFCRFEVVRFNDSFGPFVLDVAHNPDGFIHLRQAIEKFYPGIKFRVFLAMSKNHDPVECLTQLNPIVNRVDCVYNGHARLSSAEELALLLKKAGFLNVYPAPLETIAQSNEPTIVCGSFFIMHDVRQILKIYDPSDSSFLIPIQDV